MASAFGTCVSGERLPRRYVALGAALAAVPDVDAIGYWCGIPYESLFGHRGFTHSLFCAVLLSLIGAFIATRVSARAPPRAILFPYLLLCTASHGVLDAFTNGGLGIAFWSPFSNARYFMPATPVEVAPLYPGDLLTEWGVRLLWSELTLTWLPALALACSAWLIRRARRGIGA